MHTTTTELDLTQREKVVKALARGYNTVQSIRQITGLSDGPVRRALAALTFDRTVYRTGEPARGRPTTYALSSMRTPAKEPQVGITWRPYVPPRVYRRPGSCTAHLPSLVAGKLYYRGDAR